ncbi:MAG TPA: HlyD family secretion protein [Tepidisphaeraceae bacterium]|nr:HlyD family secretion protein [Tepidisphaeraceae bacterium]
MANEESKTMEAEKPQIAKPATTAEPAVQPLPSRVPAPRGKKHKWPMAIAGGVVGIVLIWLAIPWVVEILNTESTDDAYVNGHVTFVAPRVLGQVVRVLVDDNNRVHKGDLLVALDPEPYQVQVNIAQAAVDAARANLVAAQAQVRGLEAEARSYRWNLDHAIEDVDNQIALLHAKFAELQSQRAQEVLAQSDYDRAKEVIGTGAVTEEDLDQRQAALTVAQAQVEEALEEIYQLRVSLGLPAKPADGNLVEVPDDLDQTFSSVRQAQASLMEAAAQLGVYDSLNILPSQMIADFYRRDPTGKGNIDYIYAQLLKSAPPIKQAQTKLEEAQRDLDQANLNLRYCNIYAEIDGVITRRNVNPGDNVIVGQGLMAIRSLTDIWVDANFKETQLDDLRIGQPVDLKVDMYGHSKIFKGYISGFTMGTGSTLALLPAENATGNFVKVVQRLPVRIDLVDYNPDVDPLFVGLSVVPTVHIHEMMKVPNAGKFLQPNMTNLPVGTDLGPEPQQ